MNKLKSKETGKWQPVVLNVFQTALEVMNFLIFSREDTVLLLILSLVGFIPVIALSVPFGLVIRTPSPYRARREAPGVIWVYSEHMPSPFFDFDGITSFS